MKMLQSSWNFWHKLLSHPSYLIIHSITVQVAPPPHCDANSSPQWWIFGTRAVLDLPWPCGKILPTSQVCIIYWRLLGMLIPLRSLYHISQTPNLTCTDSHLSAAPFSYACSHGPAKWTYWWCSWLPYSSNSSPQVAAANQPALTLQTTHLWMDYIWPIWWVSNHFESPQRSGSIFRQYQMSLMTKVPTWSIY